jgi:predicted DNA-binding transcriptional regulator YafY
MSNPASPRRRPSVHITLQRASRLHRLVRFLAESPRARSAILADLRIGLRTFYRELDLINRCGVKVRHKAKLYHLVPAGPEPEGRLPFPDPQLSFSEMAELAQCPCASGKRLADLLAAVIKPPEPPKKRASRKRKAK